MAKKKPIRLSAGEMEIVKILWEGEGLTLSEAHRAMAERGNEIGYTTVQTRLERLVEKGVLSKSAQRPARYLALLAPKEVSGPLLDLLLERVSGAVPLVAHLLQDPSLRREDLDEIKRLLDEAEQRYRDDQDAPEDSRQ
jgi:BlaI family penicillinase repressor